MGFENVTLFSVVEALVQAPAGGTLAFYTDLPVSMALRGSVAFGATTGRQVIRLRLPGTAKGHLYQIIITSTGVVRIYGLRIWARPLGADPQKWSWYVVPCLDTPADYQPVKLPIPETGTEFAAVKLPIPETSDDWSGARLPVAETPDAWSATRLPVEETAPVAVWHDLEMDE